MSLMKTLAKVAIGVAVAKGASSMMKRSGGGGQTASAGGSGGGLGGLLGSLTNSAGSAQPHGGPHSRGAAGGSAAGGGLEGMLGGLLGGGGQTSGGGSAPGGLGGLLEQLGGSGAAAGGLGGLLGGLAGATTSGGGGLLDGTDETLRRRPEQENASFGAVLNSQFDATPEPEIEPSQDQEAAAALMLAAMIQAAKSDGQFDESERAKLLDQLGDVDAAEAAFVRDQMARPVDIDALVRQTPEGMESQVYAMSLLGIDLDTQDEAQYLHKLAQAYGLKPADVNSIHADMGMPTLYA